MKLQKVMIVDDDEDILLVAALSASRIGNWQVVTAGTGMEALALAQRERPDLILLDAMMPVLDGPATIARLREDPATAAIPVIFLTARVQPQEIQSYLEIGALGVIRKPFDAMALPLEVERILRDA
jgi:two-component system OmpR family response regulator